jgi:hypothetical protein
MNQKKNPMKTLMMILMMILMKILMKTQMNRNLLTKIRCYKMRRICCRTMNYYRSPMNTLNCFQYFVWSE